MADTRAARDRLKARIRRLAIEFLEEERARGRPRTAAYRDLGMAFIAFGAQTLAASQNLPSKRRRIAAHNITKVVQQQLLRHRPDKPK